MHGIVGQGPAARDPAPAHLDGVTARAPRLQRGAPGPDDDGVTTAVAPGPAAPAHGRAGWAAVLALVAVVLGAWSAPAPARLVCLGGAAVLGPALWVLWRRQLRLAAALRTGRAQFTALVRSSTDPVVLLDDSLRVTYASPAIAALLGREPAELTGLRLAHAVHPEDRRVLFPALRSRAGDQGELAVRTARVRTGDGGWRLVQATVRDLRADPEVGALVLFCADLTADRAGPDAELLELALTDPVTGLPNRSALVHRLAAVQRQGPARATALVLLSVDGAPPAGTTVLRAITSRLARELRGEDWLARGTDGDFVVLVDGSVADAEVVAARLVATLGRLATPAGRLTAVAGVTGLGADVDPGEALHRADLALRSARGAGPGSVHRADDALRSAEGRRSALSTDLAGALARGELRLVFQPVVDVVLDRAVSVEALLRWRHPELGDVSPQEFVPLAEESPLITELGRWVLREACATVAGLPGEELAVAVNVSARHVHSGELVADVVAALAASGLPAARLVVELTESMLLDSHVTGELETLRGLGVRIAVDDFGTGWSSLAYLAGMPVDLLKMDQHFLADVEHDPQRRALCRGVLQLGTSLGLPVVVEGVTTPGQLALLREMGHRYLQGYALARPLEAGRLADGGWRTAVAVGLAAPAAGTP
ncbi:bifunctional diguanylate cyclase/phosphodiesterase [Blastococcus sp. KM273129]|uniref:putative bifunctional diguanylate cyclase/phosphodiesterase n=1 Tax=Blastococcus sp. KM273129 TaxID=2570315 RepID=UPI001F18FA31|nr:GGDEF domain-containing phosphodiesterase [Blastococcus sp. KM273129]MCF6737343.1 EAL domain-containing protein [Blastococcus sp. KM273129]